MRQWVACLFLFVAGGLLLRSGPAEGTSLHGPDRSLVPDSIEPISSVRVDVNSEGVPARLGDTVTVAGRAVTERGTFTPTAFLSVQDRTGGIHVLLPEGPSIDRGDSVQVRGVVEHKYGLTQINGLAYRVVDARPSMPTPLPLTVPTASGETHEGAFVRVRGRVLQVGSNDGGKYLILGDRMGETTAQITVFVPNQNLSQVRLSRFEVDDEIAVTGVLGQHDYNKPYTEYYQVSPRDETDLEEIGVLSAYLRIGFIVLLGGGFLAVVAVVVLRSAVKRRTEELAESRVRFRRLAEATVEGILLHEEGEIIDVNEALAGMLDQSREDLLGRTVEEVLTDVTHDLDGESFGETEEDVREAEIIRGDRSPIPVEIRTRDVTVNRRTVQVVALRDISKRREWEEGILQAKQQAEEVAQLKTAMLANMSHEIRTPLTSIIGFTEVLKDNLEVEMATLAEKAYHSSRRLMRTLDSVLRLSRLEAGAYQMEREPTRLGRVVEDTAEMLGPNADKASVAVNTRIPSTDVEGCWNEDALNRIVENLLGNAIKFTPEGGTVTVCVGKTGDEAILEVADTGIGMDPEQVSDLFLAFKQESEGISRSHEGSGLGLSIVHRLVEAHDGTIDVETEKGEGSTFVVALPMMINGREHIAEASSQRRTRAAERSM